MAAIRSAVAEFDTRAVRSRPGSPGVELGARRAVALLTADASWAMPPLPSWYRGHEAITDFLVRMPFRERWRHLPAHANGQPAVGCYAWDEQAGAYVGWILDVLTLRGDRIAAVTAFIDTELFARFGLSETLPA